jgi:hypothetical protein
MFYLRYLCLFAHIIVCPFLIVPSVFSRVYFNLGILHIIEKSIPKMTSVPMWN